MSTISFDGGTFPLEDIQENPARYVRRLERAKVTPGFALCHCTGGSAPRQLVIRRYGSLLHLAGWPDDGHLHGRQCPFHKDPDAQRNNEIADVRAAIQASALGLNVKLDITLTQRDSASGSRAGSSHSVGPRSSRRSATLLAFIQSLWMAARLNVWSASPTPRNWGACNAALLDALGESSVINGRSAHNVLHVMRRYEEQHRATINAEFDAFIARLSTQPGSTERGIIIGEINEIADTQYGKSISLRQSVRKYYTTSTLIAHAAGTYAHAWRALGDRTARVVAVLLVEKTAKGHLKLVDLAAMLCSGSFIPCDSIHEVAMANRLIAERRQFVKPMRLADGDEMLPDFELTDTVPRTHVEVYGMNGVESYEARKARKRTMRVTRNIPAIEWDVDRSPLHKVELRPRRTA